MLHTLRFKRNTDINRWNRLSNISVNPKCYSVKEYPYSKVLYDDKTQEGFTITIDSDLVTRDLCKKLVRYDKKLIKCIPKALHTRELYDIILKKDKWLFNAFSMNDELRGYYLTRLVDSGDIRVGNYSRENLSYFTVENYVTEVKRCPYYLKYVPREKHEDVLKQLPKSMFTVEMLCDLSGFKMDVKLYNEYFGHIKLYRIVDMYGFPIIRYSIDNSYLDDGYGLPTGSGSYTLSNNNLTCDPDKFLRLVNMKYIVSIQEVHIPNDTIGEIEFEHLYTITAPQWQPIGKPIKLDPLISKFSRE